MHLFKEHGVRDAEAAAGMIPVTDYGAFFAGENTGHGNPPRYKPAVYRDLVLEFYRANYFHQQGHRSEAAAFAGKRAAQ